jgi:subtilisin family serine protease
MLLSSICATLSVLAPGLSAADGSEPWSRLDPRFRQHIEASLEQPVHATLRFESNQAREAAELVIRNGPWRGSVRILVSTRSLLELEAPGEALRSLMDAEGLELVRKPIYPVHDDHVTSEGVARIFGQDWHGLGVTGEGITVVVLDSGFAGYEELLGTELPETVETRFEDFRWVFSPHGTACAEIVHDMAPDAKIELWQATTSGQIMSLIDEIIERGDVQVVNFSAGFPGFFPADGSSEVSLAVLEAMEAGITFVNSAGNNARRSWSGTVEDADGDGILELDGEEDFPIRSAGDLALVRVRWEDTWGKAEHDIDLVLYDEDGVECDRAETPQGGFGLPFEEVSCTTGRATLNLLDRGDAAGVRAWLYSEADLPGPVRQPAGSVTVPADSMGALAVGAVRGDGQIAGFSSHGPTDDGRIKPELAAPTWVATVAYGGANFGGTSAAAPHAAGFAALLHQLHPWADAEEIGWLMEFWTEDLGEPGKDMIFGAGALRVELPPMELDDPDGLAGPEPLEPTIIEPAGCSCDAGRSHRVAVRWLAILIPALGLVRHRATPEPR